jgi:hypothetical protein
MLLLISFLFAFRLIKGDLFVSLYVPDGTLLVLFPQQFSIITVPDVQRTIEISLSAANPASLIEVLASSLLGSCPSCPSAMISNMLGSYLT